MELAPTPCRVGDFYSAARLQHSPPAINSILADLPSSTAADRPACHACALPEHKPS